MITKKCLLCFATNIADLGKIVMDNNKYPSDTHIKKCLNCGLCWINPLPDEKKLAKIYSGVYHYHPSGLKDKLLYLINLRELGGDHKLITSYKKSGRILDIGAGRGDMLEQFSAENWDRWAYDPFLSTKETNLLKEKMGKHVNDYKSLDKYPKNYFDAVVIRNVIEHTRKFKELIKSTYTILKKGGVVFIRTPNIDSLDYKLFKNNWYTARMGGHMVFFNKDSMARLVDNSKLKVKHNKPIPRSYPLSFMRSVNLKLPYPVIFVVSITFSITSAIFNNGGDLLTVAKKQ